MNLLFPLLFNNVCITICMMLFHHHSSDELCSSVKWISLGQILNFPKINPGQLYKKIIFFLNQSGTYQSNKKHLN